MMTSLLLFLMFQFALLVIRIITGFWRLGSGEQSFTLITDRATLAIIVASRIAFAVWAWTLVAFVWRGAFP